MAERPKVNPESSGSTVTIACKLPHGLVLRIFDMVSTQEPVMGGGYREVKIARELPQTYVVNGNSHPQNKAPKSPISGGYALTFGIPKDFWDRWLKENQQSDVVLNGLIFAHEKPDYIQDKAEDNKAVTTGLERLNPDRLPKGLERFNGKEA